MRTSSRAAVALALAAAACSSAKTTISAGVVAPTAIVAFQGVTSRYVNADGSLPVRPYVAVASGSGSELRLIDPTDDRPILGQTLVFALSIPTNPRPLFLAAASLGDGGADLLAVAGPSTVSGPVVEIVDTWEKENRILPSGEVAIPGTGSGSEILSLAAGPVLDANGAVVAGKARLVVGLGTATGGHLAVVDVTRGADGSVVAGTPVVQPLVASGTPFDPLDLAFSPDGKLLFVASTDPIGTVRGVAQLAVGTTPDASTWTVTPLDARDGTTKVATAVLVEKTLVSGTAAAGPDVFPDPTTATPQLLVYAALDPDGCGDTFPIRCGIATLVPGSGLAPDPTRQIATAIEDPASTKGMSYRAPIELALGVPMALATSGAPANPGLAGSPCVDTPAPRVDHLRLAPALGQRCTTGMAIVASSDGNSYLADLGRFSIPSTQSIITDTTTNTRVTAAASTLPVGVNGVALGLLDSSGNAFFDSAKLPGLVQLTPGFTPLESFAIEWQGLLPALAGVPGVVMRIDATTVMLASQADSGVRSNGQIVWLPGVNVAAPAAGVHGQADHPAEFDLAEIVPIDDVGLCDGDTAATRVAGTGHVLQVLTAADATTAGFTAPTGALRIEDGCYASNLAVGAFRRVLFSVRAGGLVVYGSGLGYLGRATFGAPYVLRYDSTKDVPDTAPTPQSEDQLLARKARRRFYPTDSAGCTSGGCGTYPLKYNLDEGPAIAFTPTHGGASTDVPPQGAKITIATDSGYRPFAARPSGAVLPVAATKVDRSAPPLSQALEIRWYIAYSDDEVYVFGPAEAANQPFSIR